MSKTNCCNCGAALDIFEPKCKFCGTKNINLSDIDLASGEAANFIFKMPNNIRIEDQDGNNMYMSMLAVPELKTIEMTNDSIDIYGGWNDTKYTFTTNYGFEMGLNLRAVTRPQTNELCRLTIK